MEDQEIVELGSASKLTQGQPTGIWTEPSVLPLRTCPPNPMVPTCPHIED